MIYCMLFVYFATRYCTWAYLAAQTSQSEKKILIHLRELDCVSAGYSHLVDTKTQECTATILPGLIIREQLAPVSFHFVLALVLHKNI